MLDRATFCCLRRLIYDTAGIWLSDHKMPLVSARLAKRLRELDLPSYRAYYRLLKEDSDPEELHRLHDAISTNVTSFFRGETHFDFIRDRARRWSQEGQLRFRFWSAACSSGEEPYTLAMVMEDALSAHPHDLRILATDLSDEMLVRCREGRYSEKKLEPVSPAYRRRFFREADDGEGDWEVKDCLRRQVTFRKLNLAKTPFPMHGPFDAIFCRNVMIYFDLAVRRRLLAELHRLLRPGGFLVVGHAEGLSGQVRGFRSVRASIYVKE